MTLEKEFIEMVENYLREITDHNFHSKYSGIMDIILEYNAKGIGRSKILELLSSIDSENLNEAQDEIIIDAVDRIIHNTSPHWCVYLKE